MLPTRSLALFTVHTLLLFRNYGTRSQSLKRIARAGSSYKFINSSQKENKHVRGGYIAWGNKYPYMKPSDIGLVSLGVLAIFIAIFCENFGSVPRSFARTCLVVVGVAAIITVLWHRI